MSAPTPAPGDDRPREGYYPDPSIPGYVRYWNGASWVPGTSRPAPSDGRPLTPPPGGGPAASVEETGPHFFDEDPAVAPADPYGGGPEPASAWGADRSRQSGFGGDQDRRVSWGSPQAADPRVPAPAQPEGQSTSTDGMTTIPPAEPAADGAGAGDVVSGGTFVFRRPTAGDAGAAPSGPAGPVPDEGAAAFRAPAPRTGHQDGAPGAPPGSTPAAAPGPVAGYAPGTQGPTTAPPAPPATPAASAKPGFGAGKAAAERAAAQAAVPAPQGPAAFPAAAAQQVAPSLPQQAAGPGGPIPASPQPAVPTIPGSGGGQPSWAQQVHRLAGEDGPVAPWKPPVEDIFQAAARRQSEARPAGLGKRFAARLVDTVVLAAVTGAAAVPLGLKALDHVNDKIDAAKLTGETVTVWLLDGTTSVYLGIVLAVLLVFGVVYEALPTAKWGRTLGKKLFGLEVRDIEGGSPPSFGAALRRWLVYSVPGLLVVGVVGVFWGLFDKPWRQCWHDKAAHTFVAG